jgi:hypothetical protein
MVRPRAFAVLRLIASSYFVSSSKAHRGMLLHLAVSKEATPKPERSVDGSTYSVQRTTIGAASEDIDGEETLASTDAHAVWHFT